MINKKIYFKTVAMILFIITSFSQAMLNRLFSPSLQRSAFYRAQQKRSYMSTNESPSFRGFLRYWKDWLTGKYEADKGKASQEQARKMVENKAKMEKWELDMEAKDTARTIRKYIPDYKFPEKS